MHSFTHEYQKVAVKDKAGRKVGEKPVYKGSRCFTEGCADNRHPVMLPLLAASPNQMLFPRHSRFVAPQKKRQ